MILGDSFLENLEVPYEKIFHEIVESKLQQSNPACDVVAIGSQGYSNSQELLAFRRFEKTVEPDVVLTAFYTGNDFEDNERRTFAYLDDAGELVFPENKPTRLKRMKETSLRWLYETSHLVYWVKNTVQAVAHIQLNDPSKAVSESDQDYQKRITFKLLEKIDSEVTAAGASHGLILFPSRDELAEKDLQKIQLVADFCEKHSIPVLNFSMLEAKHFLEHDFHFTESGHQFVAERTLDFLEENFGERLK